jgi:hypothetical protein
MYHSGTGRLSVQMGSQMNFLKHLFTLTQKGNHLHKVLAITQEWRTILADTVCRISLYSTHGTSSIPQATSLVEIVQRRSATYNQPTIAVFIDFKKVTRFTFYYWQISLSHLTYRTWHRPSTSIQDPVSALHLQFCSISTLMIF